MSNIEIAHTLFKEVSSFEQVQHVSFYPNPESEDTQWVFAMDDDTLVGVTFSADTGHLTFTVSLGPVPQEKTAEIHKYLLQLNFIWSDESGLFASLDADDDPALMFRCSLLGLHANPLLGLLTSLTDQRRAWAQMIEQNEPENDITKGDQAYIQETGIRI